MEETKTIAVDPKLIANIAITGIGVVASIGAAGVTGAILGSCNMGKVSQMTKIFGIAGLSMAGGYMAGDAMRRAGNETYEAIDAIGKIIKACGGAATEEEPKTEDKEE